MFRDLSREAEAKLKEYVNEVTETTFWGKIKDSIDDFGLIVQTWIGKLNINNYINDVDTYHLKILDKNNTTIEQISEIFASIRIIDSKYGTALRTEKITLRSYKKFVEDLADCIDPKGGNLNLTKMDSVLSADLDEIAEARASKESIVTDALLGTDPDGNEMSTDPVNLATGNFTYEHRDMQINGEIGMEFHRYYNAKDMGRGALGKGFRHNYEACINVKPDGNAEYITADGQRRAFIIKDGAYEPSGVTTEELAEKEDGYVLKLKDGDIWTFDKSGRITRQEDRNNRGISFNYNEKKQLAEAVSDNGDTYKFEYNEAGYLAKVEDKLGRSVCFEYEKDTLIKAVLPENRTYTYRYGKGNRITEVINGKNIATVKAEYDNRCRVTHQEFPDGGHMEFEYDDKAGTVIQTERNGSRTVYVHDDRYRNTEIRYADGTKEKFVYNDKNQKISQTDRNGHTSRMAYDNRGNLVQITDAERSRVNLTYDKDNNLETASLNGKEVLRNHYDGKGNLVSTERRTGASTMLTYDGMGRLSAMTDEDGVEYRLGYDERGNIVSLMSSKDGETAYIYDEANRVIESRDAFGYATKYEYDKADRLVKVVNALGDEARYTYDEAGKVTEAVDFDGYSVSASYNELNKQKTQTDKEGNVTSYEYDKMWNLSEITRADGGKLTYMYNQDNRLEKTVLPDGGIIEYGYDAAGNLISETNAEGHTKTYEYDSVNRVIKETDEEGNSKGYQYDRDGQLVCITDALGNETRYTYDDKGQLTEQTDVLGNKTRYSYLPSGKICGVEYPNGVRLELRYDNGRIKEVSHSDGSRVAYGYDAAGNLISETNALGESVTYEYDALRRVTGIMLPNGGKRTYRYDKGGHVVSFTDENGNETRYSYSPNGNLTAVTDALGNETKYEYDAVGHLIKAARQGKDAGEQVTAYEWNSMDQVISVTDPMNNKESYEYDLSGNISVKIDRDGYRTEFKYNKTGDMTDILYADGKEVAFTYDALRHLSRMKDWNGTTDIISDAVGRALSVTDAAGKEVRYRWGSMGEKLAMVYSEGKEAEYRYNNKGQLKEMVLPTGIVTYGYDGTGRLIEKRLPNGITTSYEYNELNRIREIRHEGNGVSEFYRYEYDPAGNKISAEKSRPGYSEDNGLFSYGYDALNQLTSVSRDGNILREYGYDAYGNRVRKTEHRKGRTEETLYRYNQKDQLTEEIREGMPTAYAYDRRGNLREVSSAEGIIRKYTFDARNILSEVTDYTNGQIRTAEYGYNGLGNRVSQKVKLPESPEKTIHYTLDLTRQYYNLLEERTPEGMASYYWDGNVTGVEKKDSCGFYIQDDLGSPMGVYDEEAGLREINGYDEYGIELGNDNIIHAEKLFGRERYQAFGFTGYQKEAVGGLYYAQARRYDAGAGRFVSEDKIRGFIDAPYTLNHYGYCWNNPEDLVDVDGRFAILAAIAIGAGIGAIGSAAADAISQGIKMAKGEQEEFKVGECLGSAAQGLIVGGTTAIPGLNVVAAGVATVVAGGVGAAANSAISQGIDKGTINVKRVGEDALVGAVVSGVFYTGGQLVKVANGKFDWKAKTNEAVSKASEVMKQDRNYVNAILENGKKVSGKTRKNIALHRTDAINALKEFAIKEAKGKAIKFKFSGSSILQKSIFTFLGVKTTKQIMTDSAKLISPVYEEEGDSVVDYLKNYVKGGYDKLTTPMEGETGCDCA